MRSYLLIALVLSIFIVGCLGLVGGDYSRDYTGNLQRIAVSDPDQIERCEIGSCWCMVCENGTGTISLTWDYPFFDFLTSMVGGKCYFDKECTPDRLTELRSQKMTRQFMIGQGPSFADFGAANGYCSNKLSMAVHWLTGDNQSHYSLPDPYRAMCLLDKGVMPVYVLYSKGTDIDATRAREIADVLGHDGQDIGLGRLTSGPVGPVVITTEINYDRSQASQIAAQVRSINEGCGNDRANNEVHCLVAIAPKMNDYAAMDDVLSQVGDQVDLVAYGVDYRYARGCNGGQILEQARNFSGHALYDWGKPSIIPYVMFDSEGSDGVSSCEWSESKMIYAYSSFFPNGVVSLQEKGVIGVAVYSFNSTSYGSVGNPLGCVDCSIAKNPSRLRAWYGGCQAYTRLSTSATAGSGAYPSPGTEIVFPNASAGYCDYNSQLDFVFNEMTYGDVLSRDFANPQMPELQDPDPSFIRCDACLTWTNNTKPFAFKEWSLNAEDLELACNSTPELEAWASARNLDPTYVRATIYIESKFQNCSIARVCKPGYNAVGPDGRPCFQTGSGERECYAKGISNMSHGDPSGVCTFADAPNADDPDANWRWCSMGIMASNEPAYTYWPATHTADGTDGEFYEILQDAQSRGWGLELDKAKSCNQYFFNPFNNTDSICVGTAKLEDMFANARDWIDHNRGAYLNWGEDDFEKDNAFTGYIVAQMYAGFWNAKSSSRCHGAMPNWQCWMQGFQWSWTHGDESCDVPPDRTLPSWCESRDHADRSSLGCPGYNDFVDYMYNCEIQYLPREADPGSEKMGLYYHLKENCENSACPDWKKIYDATGGTWGGTTHSAPLSGTWLVPDPA